MRHDPRPALLAVLLVAAFVTLALPRPVAACSCVPPDMILEGAAEDPATAVFTAVIGPSMGAETSASVTRWFKGGIPLPIVIFEVNIGDGAGCGLTGSPPAGKEYLFATPLEGNRAGLSLCSLMADVGTPEGQAMLATARTFGREVVPSATAPAAAGEDPAPEGPLVSMLGAVVPLVVAVAFAIGLIAGLAVILRRRQGPREER